MDSPHLRRNAAEHRPWHATAGVCRHRDKVDRLFRDDPDDPWALFPEAHGDAHVVAMQAVGDVTQLRLQLMPHLLHPLTIRGLRSLQLLRQH